MRRRLAIPQRKPIFIGCEGESEQGYAQVLRDLAERDHCHVHLHVEVLRMGDALSRIEFARRKVEELKRKRTEFTGKFLMLDTDEFAQQQEGMQEATRRAEENGFRVIWQEPCFEGLLLRHFQRQKPMTNVLALQALRREWPEYRKGMTRAEMGRRIGRTEVMRAANLELGLAELLRVMGFLIDG